METLTHYQQKALEHMAESNRALEALKRRSKKEKKLTVRELWKKAEEIVKGSLITILKIWKIELTV